ncbi:transcription antitermination factor NusB [uncultured Helicobacter sp.]|uniref:transcription antitermination factor NusB n=1 Tax=uncultured Helicobacter sp. TaxID=175537 RepID=UPI00374F2744
MATRTQARNAVLGILYAYDLGNHASASMEDAIQILEEKKIRHKQQEFALALLNGVLKNLNALDTLINAHLKEWDLSRLGRIECSILRLGAYELCYTQTDVPIVINEAIELGKMYGDENAPKLINGVLDSIQKSRSKDAQ